MSAVKVLSHSKYRSMLWKNGLGKTLEIFIDPEDAQFPESFNCRMSSAYVEGNNRFSSFEGFHRVLIVVEGDGLLLNGVELKPLVPYFFSGSDPIDCHLMGGAVVDLGVIFQKQKYEVSVDILKNAEIYIPQSENKKFIYLVRGEALVGSEVVRGKDTIYVPPGRELRISGCDLTAVVVQMASLEKQS